jgi:hypothetical protein
MDNKVFFRGRNKRFRRVRAEFIGVDPGISQRLVLHDALGPGRLRLFSGLRACPMKRRDALDQAYACQHNLGVAGWWAFAENKGAPRDICLIECERPSRGQISSITLRFPPVSECVAIQ